MNSWCLLRPNAGINRRTINAGTDKLSMKDQLTRVRFNDLLSRPPIVPSLLGDRFRGFATRIGWAGRISYLLSLGDRKVELAAA